jgi:NADPH-ferrihemoprotein reductase
MTILYASQTGTAEEFARQFSSEAKRFGFSGKVVDLIDYEKVKKFVKKKENLNNENLVVFLIATYGEGEPTDNSREFHDWVISKDRSKDELSNLKYVIFGLGNKQYRVYQAIARLFDKKFEQMGATNLYVRGEGDADATLEEDFEEWKQNVLPLLSQKYNTKTTIDDNKL